MWHTAASPCCYSTFWCYSQLAYSPETASSTTVRYLHHTYTTVLYVYLEHYGTCILQYYGTCIMYSCT